MPTKRRLATLELEALEAAQGGSCQSENPLGWALLLQRESSGNYSLCKVGSPTCKYRGAFQFDMRTWRSVGGEGDPLTASPSYQDQMACRLFQSRGGQPWPENGHFLSR